MSDLTQYRIFCLTELDWVSKYSLVSLTTCPNNINHLVNLNSVQILIPGTTLLNQGNYKISSTIDATAINTGALIINQGGISVFGQVQSAGINTINNTTESVSSTTGSMILKGGLGLSKQLSVAGLAKFYLGLDANLNKIINCATPTFINDVANKFYVDSVIPPPPVELYVSSTNVHEIISSVPTIISEMNFTPSQAGFYKVDFNAQFVAKLSNVTAQGVLDINNLYNTLVGLTKTSSMFPTFLTSTTILPGVYESVAAVSMAGTITFNGQGNNNSLFIFKINAACTAAASSTFVMTNGAHADNIFFVVQGALSVGANASLAGTFISPASALSTGVGAFIHGRLLTKNGAIAISGSVQVPNTYFPFELGVIKGFVLFTTIGDVSNTGNNVVVGDVGTNSGNVTGFETTTMTGSIYLPGSGSSQTLFGIYVGSVVKDSSIRDKTDCICIKDVILADVVTITANQVISIKCTNIIGTSLFYNRFLSIRKMV